MKRHRFLTFSLDTTRNFFKGDIQAPLLEKYKEEQRQDINQKYGLVQFDKKFDRWLSIPKPNISVVDEHTHLLQDIEDSYILGSLYSALTGACCLGERIFNQIILRVKQSYCLKPEYKFIYKKESINDWNLGINVLFNWGIINSETKNRYQRLAGLRTASVHFQNKEQDLSLMAKEAIFLINEIVSDLFELNKDKSFLLWFNVPGELYLKKEAEQDPFIRAFYIPCAPLVGYKHTIENTPDMRLKVLDKNEYMDKEVSDEEFVILRNEYVKK